MAEKTEHQHDLRPMADDDPRAIEGAEYVLDGKPVRLTKINGSWYFDAHAD